MHIVVISQYFPPEVVAGGNRASELAEHWHRLGHQVTVLTGFPNHPTGELFPEYRTKIWRLIHREEQNGIRVVRTWLLPLSGRGAVARILNYVSFWLSASLTGSFIRRPDIVVATSPPLLVGLAGWWISRVRRTPFVFDVRDLWPESIAELTSGRVVSMTMRPLAHVARFLYRSADHVVAVSQAIQRTVVHKGGIDGRRVSVIANGIETDALPKDVDVAATREAWGLANKFVVVYVGTIGVAHGLQTVLKAAVRLRDAFPELLFLFVGDGPHRAELQRMASELELENVRFIGQVPRQQALNLIAASQIGLVPLRKAEVFKTVIPTKMLEYMALGRPVILGVEGQAREILEEAEAGLPVEPDDPVRLAAGIEALYHDEDLRDLMGRRGQRYVREHFSRRRAADQYATLLEERVRG